MYESYFVVKNITELIADFPPVTKEQWLAQIEKDLKGKQPLDNLYWQPETGVRPDPFGHVASAPSLSWSGQALSWRISEDVEVGRSGAEANAQALGALEQGAESLCFYVPDAMPDWALLLEHIYLDFIELHFAGAGAQQQPAALLGTFQHAVASRKSDPAKLLGSVAYDPLEIPKGQQVDWRHVYELLDFAHKNLPNFRTLSLHVPTAPTKVAQLVGLLQKAQRCTEALTQKGAGVEEIADHLQFSLVIGSSYFLEMATLRAFRLLWYHFCDSWGIKSHDPLMEVRFAPEAYTDELYTNMIRATTMTMSAALGGAHRITVRPYDAGRRAAARYPAAFGRRIALNVQHLLKMESHFDQAPDPAAGSYYIEDLTHQLAERAWSEFTAGR